MDNNAARFNCDELLEEFERDVKADGQIQLNREGRGESLLGVSYTFNEETGEVTANQAPYIEKVGSKWGLSANSHGVKLPLKPGDAEKIMSLPIPSIPNQAVVSSYAKLCGELMFVGLNTMPTIIYSIHLLTRFMTNATKSHLDYAKTVLRYVYSNRHRSITYCASRSTTLAPGQLGAYADSSWADVIPARKSTYSYVLMLNNAAVSWRSALSTTIATSTAAAELIALCSCAQEVAWARKFLSEIGFPQLAPTTIFEDNAAAKAIAEQSNFKGKNKHYELRWQFICEFIERGIIRIEKIPRRLQLADLGTGPRPYPDFLRLSSSIYGEDFSSEVQP